MSTIELNLYDLPPPHKSYRLPNELHPLESQPLSLPLHQPSNRTQKLVQLFIRSFVVLSTSEMTLCEREEDY